VVLGAVFAGEQLSTGASPQPVLMTNAVLKLCPNQGLKQQRAFVTNMRVWKVVRTQAEVRENMKVNSVDDNASLFGSWALNEGFGVSDVHSCRCLHPLALAQTCCAACFACAGATVFDSRSNTSLPFIGGVWLDAPRPCEPLPEERLVLDMPFLSTDLHMSSLTCAGSELWMDTMFMVKSSSTRLFRVRRAVCSRCVIVVPCMHACPSSSLKRGCATAEV
jgi:hypothetical protein